MKSMVFMLMFLFAAFSAVVGLAISGCSVDPGASNPNAAISGGSIVSAYTVIFDGQGATIEANPAVISNATAVDVLPIAPVKTGYGFVGWYSETNGLGTELIAGDPVSANTTVYAKWNANTYTVTFDSMGGSMANPTSITVTSPATTVGTLPTEPTKPNYIFMGWSIITRYYNPYFTASTKVTSDITVYALWQNNINK